MSQACPDRHGDIGAYIVGALDCGTKTDVRRHLAACPDCRAEYEDLLPVRHWLGRLTTVGLEVPLTSYFVCLG
jgi:anti-sigma factor RsiW